MSLRPAARRKKHADRREAENHWLETPLEGVNDALRELTQVTVDRELASREALNGRLAGAITFAGALLAVALAFGQKASPSAVHHVRHEIFMVGLIAAVVVLAVALVTALLGLRPELRHHTSIRLLKALRDDWERRAGDPRGHLPLRGGSRRSARYGQHLARAASAVGPARHRARAHCHRRGCRYRDLVMADESTNTGSGSSGGSDDKPPPPPPPPPPPKPRIYDTDLREGDRGDTKRGG